MPTYLLFLLTVVTHQGKLAFEKRLTYSLSLLALSIQLELDHPTPGDW